MKGCYDGAPLRQSHSAKLGFSNRLDQKDRSGLGQLYGPFGIAVDQCGVVYVCDRDNNRVQIFS